MRLSSSLAFFLLTAFPLSATSRTTITVAAAADLSSVEPQLAAAFHQANHSLSVQFINGASAALAQQIKQGAPFDVFLSANVELVDQLHLDSPKTYTVGRVAMLWKDKKPHELADLDSSAVQFIAMPNPKLAPYGLAAQQALQRAGLWDRLQPKIVYAENVRQTLQLFDSGNTDAVVTALSLVIDRHPQIVPSHVIQKAGIVPATKSKEASLTFLAWLLSSSAQAILSRYGFDKP